MSGNEDIEPIVLSIDVAATAEEAFERFTAGFGEWWPVATHSLSRTEATRCVLEARVGGRVYERAEDGAEHRWGTVTAVAPGASLAFTWHPGREPASAQWVELRFEGLAQGSRVTLTHGGWDALGEIAPIMRREYVPGWRHVFGHLYAGFAGRRH